MFIWTQFALQGGNTANWYYTQVTRTLQLYQRAAAAAEATALSWHLQLLI